MRFNAHRCILPYITIITIYMVIEINLFTRYILLASLSQVLTILALSQLSF